MRQQHDNPGEGNHDPVCGMTVTKDEAACSYEHKGRTYYFCALSCRDSFVRNPERYLEQG
jgi:Cu+-exporting ATPase